MSNGQTFAQLRATRPVILPSMLLCDFGNLEREIRAVENAGARALHLDIMDGHFVPNITYGFTIVEAVRRVTELPLDVHLMISNPGQYIQQFVASGASLISIHIEAVEDPRPVLDEIRSLGAAAGLVLNPPTPISAIAPFLDACDYVLAMTVMPGYGGQEFDESVLSKVRDLRAMLPPEVLVEVDGGVGPGTIATCAAAGAEMFVAGSAIFRTSDYAASLKELQRLAQVKP
ncbi:ribulose-phosphate 3-epimerase [Bythopirellula polymerisocia]|uniref:Ribulose-phosphate 3-epimerase n=1 Tax=Bythopirellula polymerisocia TaxID=2528003 RepID=A0A5C6CZK4_9BACT|nr:ribulose-phosphate 3-epimerase [Bythopirellula polymerisocia]TWU30072.1 Ribulose-phosphate 3-epimerase [Bythopirellula polymerisocia]